MVVKRLIHRKSNKEVYLQSGNQKTLVACLLLDVIFNRKSFMHQAKTAMCFRNGALLCAILILNIQGCSQSIESAVDTETKKFHFKEIATACINFHDANAKFPFPEPFSDTVHKDISWRVLASLYCDGEPTYMAFDVDEPWDSKNNLPLSKQMHTPFGFGSSGEKTSVCWIKANDKTF